MKNILEHIRNEERLTTQQLWQAAKPASAGELAASIAHEMNNPLATVSLRLEPFLEQIPENDGRHKALTVVEREVERMKKGAARSFRSVSVSSSTTAPDSNMKKERRLCAKKPIHAKSRHRK